MPLSKEVLAIINYLANTGVPFKVTSTTGGVHAPGSYHYQEGTDGDGLAVDVAGPLPSQNSPELLAIFGHLAAVKGQLAELIYSGAPFSVKNGLVVPRYAIPQHWNHVHVAVPRGTFLKGPAVPDDPNLPNITGPVSFHPIFTSDGRCTGYYIFSQKTGEVHSFGPGATYHGRSEVIS